MNQRRRRRMSWKIKKKKRRKKNRARGKTIITPSRGGYQWIQIGNAFGSGAYIRGAVFLVSAYAKPVSHGWCSQSLTLWIMHAIFARAKRNARSRLPAYMYICICLYKRAYIRAICIYTFWRVRRWNRTVIRMIYMRWTVDFEMPGGRPLESYFEKASWEWIRRPRRRLSRYTKKIVWKLPLTATLTAFCCTAWFSPR